MTSQENCSLLTTPNNTAICPNDARKKEWTERDSKRDALAISRLAQCVSYNYPHKVSNDAIMLSCPLYISQLIVCLFACFQEVGMASASKRIDMNIKVVNVDECGVQQDYDGTDKSLWQLR
jgi:hypothetical protein